jgi:hypothetical protein
MSIQERKTNLIPEISKLRVGQLEIPLYKLISMEKVRVAMPLDIEALQRSLRRGYIKGSTRFYVSLARADGFI